MECGMQFTKGTWLFSQFCCKVLGGMVQIQIGVFNTFPTYSSSPSPAKDTRGDISITFSVPSIVAPAASRKLLQCNIRYCFFTGINKTYAA